MAKFELSAFTDEYSQDMGEQIKGMLQNGIKYTELRGVNGKNVSEITPEQAKEVKSMLDANGLKVWSVGSPLGKIKLTDDINKHIDLVKRVCETANLLDTENIRVFSFYVPSTSDIAPYRAQVMEYMSMMLEASKPYGVKLCHENEKGIYGAKTEGVADILKTYGDGYKCIFDPANFIQEDVVTYPDAFNVLKDDIYYMHIKDARADKSIAPAGKGIGRIPEILSELNKREGTVILTLEPHLRVFSGLAQLEESGSTTEIIDQYPTAEAAFNAATNALKSVIASL
jgi:sugar phosphate isomerase/epimerase